MLRLDLPTESFWVECPYGVRLLVRPMTTAMSHVAGTRAARRVATMKAANPADQNLNDPEMLAGLMTAEVTVAMAEVAVEAWEGVFSASGTEVAPLTPDGLRILMTAPAIARAFSDGIDAPLARMAAEGNA